MKISICTPTHQPTYLLEAYHSLKLQTLQDWEWVIFPSGNNVTIPDAIRSDSRVKIVSGNPLHNIGAIKRKTFSAATGDILVELDHDDLIVPGNSLEVIKQKFLDGAGFVYSDNAVFKFNPKALDSKNRFIEFTWSGHHGWESYPIEVYGRKLKASKCFDITPRSLAEIYYCPDHVRCWHRDVYQKAGGHNPDLSVCDDQELMIKTYLTGAKFQHTGGCHYLYRLFGNNTIYSRQKQIQEVTQKFKVIYLNKLIKEWLKRNNFAELDISRLRKDGWHPDRHLMQGFGENNWGHIIADSELQKMTGSQVREFMNLAYCSLVPGGYLTIIVPEVHSGMAFADVEWKSHFSAVSMYPYTRKDFARDNGNIRCRYQQINCTEVYPSEWHKNNGFKFLRFELVALKGQRHPALQHI
jgi:glycosyltransferase involved in cell wall biosynthesis